jgi:tetratricopeptide (TPR) repeat protein
MIGAMRCAGLLGMLLAVGLLAACPSQQERAERAGGEARAALARGDRNAALEALRDLRDHRADSPEALLELAQLLVYAGEAPQVAWLLEEGVRSYPDREDLRIMLARVALGLGSSSTALAALEPIGPESPRHVDALLMRGQAELRLGDMGKALEAFVAAEELYPDQPQGLLARIRAFLSERRIEDARAAFEQARQRFGEGEHADTLRQVEVALLTSESEKEDAEAAIAGLRGIVEAHPKDTAAWRALVQAMWKKRQVEPAIELLEAAIAEDPGLLELHTLLVPLLTAVGRDDDAERLLREQVEGAPSPTSHMALVRYHVVQERFEEGLVLLDEALEAFPQSALLERVRVETLIQLGEIERAREAVDEYATGFAGDPYVEYLRARMELASGDAAAAAARLTKAMPLIDEGLTQYWLGKALQATGDDAAAERRFGLALRRQPREPGIYAPVIELAERRGDWRGVAFAGSRLVRLTPGRFDAWATLIAGEINLGDGKAAVANAARCAKIFPDEPEAALMLARAQRTAGDNDAALEGLARARERFGASAAMAAEEALTLAASGRVGEGVSVAQQGLAAHPDSAELQLAVAALFFAVGQAEEGAQAVDRALELAPDDPQPLRKRAQFRAATGRLEGALRDSERYLEQRPDDAAVRFMLGTIQEGLGRSEQAIATYRRAAELDPTAFAPRNNLALLLADTDLDAALAAGQEAYSLAPESVSALDTLGSLYLRKGLVERGTSLLEEAHARAPEEGEVQLHLALAYRAAGRSDDARRLLVDLEGREGSPEALTAAASTALRSLP